LHLGVCPVVCPKDVERIPLLEECAAELVPQRRAVGGQAAPVPGLVAEGNRRPAPGVEGFDVRLPLIARGELRMTARDLAEHRQARRRLRVAEWQAAGEAREGRKLPAELRGRAGRQRRVALQTELRTIERRRL